ncbi:MAG: hypothetical protein D6710_01775 [Nitrospirae bacterium]|nr:MAG: hypothetical protein D6710_01775 [Nitrospirota bacterium]
MPPREAFPAFPAIMIEGPFGPDRNNNHIDDLMDEFQARVDAGTATEVRIPPFPYALDYFSPNYFDRKWPYRIYFAHFKDASYYSAYDEQTDPVLTIGFNPELNAFHQLYLKSPGLQEDRMNFDPNGIYSGDWMPVLRWGTLGFPNTNIFLTAFDGLLDFDGPSGIHYWWVLSQEGANGKGWNIYNFGVPATPEQCADPCQIYGWGGIFPDDCTIAWGQGYIGEEPCQIAVSSPEADGRVSTYLMSFVEDGSDPYDTTLPPMEYPETHITQYSATIYNIDYVGYMYYYYPTWPGPRQYMVVWVDFESGLIHGENPVPNPADCYQ